MNKRIALLLVVLLLIPSTLALGESSDGKVLNIHCWNNEFQTRFETFYQVPEGVTVNFVVTPSQDNAYQNALDQALLSQESAAADDKVDIFLVEADYALKYSDSDFTLDVYGDVGLTEADTAGMPDAVVKRIRAGFTTGAAVTFVVFNPEMTEILAEAGRKELQSDKKATAEFKKKVQEAKRALR